MRLKNEWKRVWNKKHTGLSTTISGTGLAPSPSLSPAAALLVGGDVLSLNLFLNNFSSVLLLSAFFTFFDFVCSVVVVLLDVEEPDGLSYL